MDPTNLNPTAKAVLIIGWMIFNVALIALVTMRGDPHNSLQTSAQWWSYVSVLATLAGLGFPTMLDAIKMKAPA